MQRGVTSGTEKLKADWFDFLDVPYLLLPVTCLLGTKIQVRFSENEESECNCGPV